MCLELIMMARYRVLESRTLESGKEFLSELVMSSALSNGLVMDTF